MSGVQTTVLELESLLEGVDLSDFLGSHHLDGSHLVGGTETVEEVEDGVTALKTTCDYE